jgi:hypothetical protein
MHHLHKTVLLMNSINVSLRPKPGNAEEAAEEGEQEE